MTEPITAVGVCMSRTVFKDRDARSSLSYMAQAWLRLAERNDFMPPTAQPVVQQQQQVQPKNEDKKD